MKLWFDADTRELVTEKQLREEYQDWLVNRVEECGASYVLENHEDFTFEVFLENSTTRWNGTLYPVLNAEHYEEVKK